MDETKKVYKPGFSKIIKNTSIILGLVFLLSTLPVLVSEAPVSQGKLRGLLVFWLVGIALSISPLLFKLEVGADYIKTYFLNFNIRTIHSSNVLVIEYGNLLKAGGLGIGKGLKVWEKSSKGRKYFSIGENMYGKEAITRAKKALESK